MKEIFISYSTVDTTSAETVRNVLEKNGFSCWMAPRDIPGGSNYTKEIPIAIRNCKVFVLILSENAQNSHWVLKELDSAVNCGKVILPFMLEDCVLHDEFNFLLTGAQRYAAYQKKAEAMETLIGRIRGILDVPASGQNGEIKPEPKADAPVKKTPPKAKAFSLGEAVCSGCGSSELTPLPRRVKRQGVKELATMLLIPLLAVAGSMVGVMIGTFVPGGNWFELTSIFVLVGLVGGSVLGDHMSKTVVRRNRLRNNIRATCFRCKRCSKIFRYDEPLEN